MCHCYFCFSPLWQNLCRFCPCLICTESRLALKIELPTSVIRNKTSGKNNNNFCGWQHRDAVRGKWKGLFSFHYKMNPLKRTAIVIPGFKNVLVYFQLSGWKCFVLMCHHHYLYMLLKWDKCCWLYRIYHTFTQVSACFPFIFIWYP